MTTFFRMALAAFCAAFMSFPSSLFADGQGTSSTIISPPFKDSTLDNPSPYNIQIATGVAATDYANLSAAFATSNVRPVVLQGIFEICQPGLFVPTNGVVMGQEVTGWSSGGNDVGASRTMIRCTGSHSFTSRTAFIDMYDRSKVMGFTIEGHRTSGDHGLDCINAVDSMGVIIENMTLTHCARAVNRASNATPPTGRYLGQSQLAKISGGYFMSNDYGYYADCSSGGFISDEIITGVNIAFNAIEQIHAQCVFELHITNNRIEYGPYGVFLAASCCVTIVGNYFDRTWPGVYIYGSGDMLITGNRIGGFPSSEGGPYDSGIRFDGNNYTLTVGPNYFASTNGTCPGNVVCADYKVDGGSLYGSFYGQQSYADAATRLAIDPYVVTARDRSFSALTLTGSTFSAPDLRLGSNFSLALTGDCPCTVPNPTNTEASDGAMGVFEVWQSIAGSSTIGAWGNQYAQNTLPTLGTLAAAPDYIPYVLRNGNIIFQAKAASPTSNTTDAITGGAGMTSGWTPSLATLTTGAGTDPAGGSAAASLKDDSTANNYHTINESITTAAGTRTMSVYIHAGGGSARGIQLYVGGGADSASYFFNSDCSAYNRKHTGSGLVISRNSIDVGGGWCRAWMTYTLGATVPDSQYIQLTSDHAEQYDGDGTSYLLLWKPQDRPGALP